MPDHTLTPKWKLIDDGLVDGVYVIFDEDNHETWFQFKVPSMEVAETIVRACNNHDRYEKALYGFSKELCRFRDNSKRSCTCPTSPNRCGEKVMGKKIYSSTIAPNFTADGEWPAIKLNSNNITVAICVNQEMADDIETSLDILHNEYDELIEIKKLVKKLEPHLHRMSSCNSCEYCKEIDGNIDLLKQVVTDAEADNE